MRGTVSEFNGLTEITIGAKADFQVCAHDAALPTPAALTLPLDPAARESVESMLVAPVGDYTVSEVYNTNRFGEVVLAAGDAGRADPDRPVPPRHAGGAGQAAANKLARLLLDDGSSVNLSTSGHAAAVRLPGRAAAGR